jgi:hypothetical protein
MERWLRSERPEIYRRLIASEVPASLREKILMSLAGDDYRRLPVWSERLETVQTDVLIITPQFSPDMLKDVLALRSQRPNIHCTLLMGPMWWGQAELTEKYFDEIIEYGDEGIVGIIEQLSRISARSTIVRGARTHLDAVAALFCSGRLVFRADEWTCAIPGYDPESESAVVETFLSGKAAGLYHYWGADANAVIRQTMDVPGEIKDISPACVDEMGPNEHLSKLSADDGEPHAVFPADLTLINGEPEHLANWRVMCAQGIHIHYHPPRPEWASTSPAIPYVEFERESEYFHIEETLDFEQALVTFTRYDWAYDHISAPRCQVNPGFESVAPNLVFTFVQADLPMIIATNRNLNIMNRLVDQFGTGLTVSTADLATVRPRMEAALDEAMHENLKKRRAFFTFDRPALASLVLPTTIQ